ncbi:unnamed protein product [Auanema sp. JU1783]|nr:unnamed protein product [Auanema sp. JU1783]
MSEKRFDDDDYSIVSATHHLRKGMPTVEEVLRAQGRRLTNEELNYMLSINAIPSIITQDMTPVLHKITRGNEDFYVLMVDEPPCSCRRMGGKKEKCDKHKNQKKEPKKDSGSTNRSTIPDINCVPQGAENFAIPKRDNLSCKENKIENLPIIETKIDNLAIKENRKENLSSVYVAGGGQNTQKHMQQNRFDENQSTPKRDNLSSVYVAAGGQNTPRPPFKKQPDDKVGIFKVLNNA